MNKSILRFEQMTTDSDLNVTFAEQCSYIVFDEQIGKDPGFESLNKRPIVSITWKSAIPLRQGCTLGSAS